MLNKCNKKVVVSMSGGVDSSVAAWLLKQKGYQVTGLFMKNWEEDDTNEYCTSAIDLADTKDVCDKIGIKLYTVNFSSEYWNNVFINFLNELKNGKTPNPDIMCNKEIKFKVFFNFAIKKLNADFIATGHYVRCNIVNNSVYLLKGIDSHKDQSYYLYSINKDKLARCFFPLGKLKKNKVRNIANQLGFKNANKKDSTGICFIGKKKFSLFIKKYLKSKPGIILSKDNDHIGYHKGLVYYTIGQRKGLGIGGIKGNNNSPWYVIKKNLYNNSLIVAQNHLNPYLNSIKMIVSQLYWINGISPNLPFKCKVKTRYQQTDIDCTLFYFTANSIKVEFNQPVFAITPGQSAVFYLQEYCLGGGIIKS